ncbi:Bzip transcription factor [Phytophthora cinnamomi]|uniref:Bzip transcription factor n=1 Tax=Phytophthora cinnamomi TaxID=4785 RepID=UPI003559830A|nr:Bzip transcription factor [Phytophthora cinnamomi]
MAKEAMIAASTLSLKDAQRCFDKERRSFLRDLETLRQQLIKKDQTAARAAAAASTHTIQLKREIASLQAAMTALEAERTKFQEQFTHTSSLLETALDQRQEDQTKLSRLNEKLRTLEKKHDETVDLVKNEAAANVRATQEERQALRARVEQLRGKLESERKEWQNVHRPMADELQKCKTRLQLVDKELQDARYRERSSFQLKEKMGGEVTVYKRKVADLSTALQEALHGKSELKAEHSLMVGHMKDKWREVLRNHQHSKEQLMMLQEDYNGLFRSRTCIEQQNEQIYQAMKQLKTRHEQAMKIKEQECWDIEKKHKKISATCQQCLKTPEQKQQDEELKLDVVREQTRLEVTKNLELERWDRFQEVNSKYLDTCKQLQTAIEENEVLRGKYKTVTNQHQELLNTEQRLSSLLKETQTKLREMSSKRDEETQQMEGTKKTMQDLVENLTSLTAVTADQSKKLQELETARLEERETMTEQIRALESDKQSIAQDHEQLTQRYDEFLAQYELLKQEKSKHWNEIVEAQLSANLLIEEQAHTIDDLLQAKADGTYVSPTKPKPSPNHIHIDSSALSSTGAGGDFTSPAEYTSLIAALRQECEALREEVARLKARLRDDRTSWQGNNDTKEDELLREVKTLQLERQKLMKRLEEQALTIHELTLQEDEEVEGDDEQSCLCTTEQVGFDPGLSSCAESYPSPGNYSETSSRRISTQTYRYPLREPSVGFWLPPTQDKRLPNRPRSRSPLKDELSDVLSAS